ncbi:hypothetical protein B0H13DRAFT_2353316 [Mycena leptocephala]|nr:hypothetical protein B0H13DRAFT_2353316 [Mycena leptocephala]
MVEIFLAFQYFQRKGRMFWHKAGVGAFIISDTACTHYTDATLLWQASLTIIATYTTALVEQAFLCYIFYALTNRRFIAGFLVLTIFIHLGISLAAAGLVAEGKKIAMTNRVSKIGAISCATTDILVAAALAATFYKMEASLTRGQTLRSLIRRLLILSLTSGVIVASFTIIHMVLLLVRNPASTIFFFCQGRAYALTLLSNFLLGVPVKSAVSQANDTSPPLNSWTREYYYPGNFQPPFSHAEPEREYVIQQHSYSEVAVAATRQIAVRLSDKFPG